MTDYFSMTEIDQLNDRIKSLTAERSCDKKTIDNLTSENNLLRRQIGDKVMRIKVLEFELKIARLSIEKLDLHLQNKSLRERLSSLEKNE